MEEVEEGGAREVTLAWAPPGVPSMLATKYLRSIPQEHLSIQVRKSQKILIKQKNKSASSSCQNLISNCFEGSEGAQRRLAALERQFPLHDVEPGQCHQLSRGEIDS